MAIQSEYIGQYGDALRQMQTGVLPKVQGGADLARPGALSQFQVNPNKSTRNADFLEPPQEGEKKGVDVGTIGTKIGGMFAGGGGTAMTGGTDVAPASAMGTMYAANGGPLYPGTTIVGEQGPEAVQMDAQGNAVVVPNGALPQAMGGADTAGGALPGSQGGTPGIVGDQKPTSWKDVHGQMSEKDKDDLADVIEERSGKSVREAYTHAAKSVGEEPKPKKKIDRREMASYVAEVALRTLSNMGSSETSAEAFGKGALQTMDSRRQIAQAEQDKQEKALETGRLEGREDMKAGEERTYKTAERQAKEKFDAEQNRLNRENDLKLQQMRDKVDRLNREGKDVKLIINDQGEYVIVDAKNATGTPVTQDVTTTETKGSRGRGTSTKTTTTKKPVKATPKPNASGVDQDTLISKIAARKKELNEDRQRSSKLRNQGLGPDEIEEYNAKQARKEVLEDNAAVTGGAAEMDWEDLK